MSRKIVYLYCLIFLATAFFSNVHAQQVFKTTRKSVIGFLEYLPKGYNSNKNDYPIVIFLHGLGERGPNGMDPNKLKDGVKLILRNGPPKHVNKGTDFPFILISPQLKSSYGDWPSWYVMEVLDYVKTYLRIDEKRIYLTGLSLGGGGTWWAAQDYPDVFAAIAPVCGSRASTAKACLLAKERLPVWAFHGNRDGTVPMSRSVNMVNAINSCNPAPNPKAKLTIYPGVGHNSWNNAYMPDHSVHNPNIYEWMLSHRKDRASNDNVAPIANAGADKTIVLPANALELAGTGKDTDGSIVSYAWAKVSGGTATLAGAATTTLKLSNLKEGEYVFRLTVKDNKGDYGTDDVKVIVKATSTANVRPVVNAGEDKTITLPSNSLELSGTATDEDGSIVSYSWTKVSGGNATLIGIASKILGLGKLVKGTYVFRLTVKDDKGAIASDDVTITVKPGPSKPDNVAPIANAGSDITITLPTDNVVVKGSGKDTDGKIVSFWWDKISGGTSSVSNITSPHLKVSKLTTGSYVFRLTVMDNDGAKSTDDVRIVVTGNNNAPIVSAGGDKSITLPTTTTVLRGSALDRDGKVIAYHWKKLAGRRVKLKNGSTPNLSISGLAEGTYVFRFIAKDNKRSKSWDDVKVTVTHSASTARAAAVEEEPSELLEAPDTTEVVADNITGELIEDKPRFDLSDSDISTLKDCLIVIFNERGEKIYTGAWANDSYHLVFASKGLYYYNVMKFGKRIDAGKIYIRE